MSLRAKIAVATALLLAALIALSTYASYRLFKPELRDVVHSQLDTLATNIADDVNQRLVLMQRVLAASASTITHKDLLNSDAAQQFLDENKGTLSVFDRSIFIFSLDGKLVAESPFKPNRRGGDYSYRSYVREVLRTKEPFISEPFVTTKNDHHMVVMFSTPVLNRSGEMVAIMAASIGLTQPDVLGRISELRIGKTGYLFLTTGSGMMIMHPDKSRIGKPAVPAPGANELFDRAMGGFQGVDETVNSSGARMVTSFKRIDASSWILGANYPQEEAYAPLFRPMQRWVALLLVSSAAILAVLLMLVSYFSAPLVRLTNTMKASVLRGRAPRAVAEAGSGEIRDLSRAFNNMVAMLKDKSTALERSIEDYRLLANNVTDLISTHRPSGEFVYASPSAATLIGYSPEELSGRSLLEFVHPEHIASVKGALDDCSVNGQTLTYLTRNKAQQYIWTETAFKAVSAEEGERAVIGVSRNVSGRKELEQHLKDIARRDPLTGLPNRVGLSEALAAAVTQAKLDDDRLALILIDLDRFKLINDSLGHHVGDELLKAAAERIVSNLRSNDLVARLGGDEFVVMLPHMRHRGAEELAERLCQALAEPFMLHGRPFYLSASLGLCYCPEDGQDVATLLKSADMAMYQAKRQGGNGTHHFHSEMETRANRTLLLEDGLRLAIEKNEFRVHYQPLIEGATGQVAGAEALVRWSHPELGLVSPAEFIPLAESNGQIVAIGRQVLRKALENARVWAENGLPTRVSVNLSARQFREEGLVTQIMDALEEARVAGEFLELEVTESALMTDPGSAAKILAKLKKLGVTVAVDDFGTGYSSFSYLKNFPLDKLKIASPFVSTANTDDRSAAIVMAITSLAHNLGLKVVAEGVETAEQAEFLKRINVDILQGYFFAKPLPEEEFHRYLWRDRGDSTRRVRLAQAG